MSNSGVSKYSSASTQSVTGLGVFTLSALVVANMIGAGVFTSSGYSLGTLGNPGRVMLAWIFCGAWAICGAIAYGSLVARLPHSGGEYLFLSRFVHPSIGFLAGWISVIAGFTAPIAFAALTAALYLMPKIAAWDPWLAEWIRDAGNYGEPCLAALVILVASLCHLIGVSLGAWVQNAIVAAKLLLIAIMVGWAFFFTSQDVWQGAALPDRDPNWFPSDLGAWMVFAGSMSWIALSYTGFNAAIYVAGESQNADRLVPRSMLWATLLVTVIYLSLNYVFVYAPNPDSISFQGDVATIASQAVGGVGLERLVRITIVLSMISSVFAMLLAGPRVYQKMAEDGVMPKVLRGASGAPRFATLVQASLSIIAVFLADLRQLMEYLGLTLSACGALAVLSLWWIRRKLPSAAPLTLVEHLALAVYLSITLFILVGAWTVPDRRAAFIAMLATFGLGGLVYIGWIRWERRAGKRTQA